ncbi:MAG: substrate-binding domain-containing protein [Planctomycetes bacterium]|nr:substrate-binding domain-containing protein [Planctomycetota bacterium]
MKNFGIEAKYDQVKRLILEEIARRDLKPGDHLPTRQSMRQRWGVANDTIEHAIRTLIQDGVLTARQGSGTFVAHVPRQPVASRSSTFTIDILIPKQQEDLAASHSPHTYLERLEGITAACDQHRLQSRLRFVSPDRYLHAEALLEAVAPFHEAVILFQEPLACRLEPYLRAQRIPYAVLGQNQRTQNSVQPNPESGYRQVFQHLQRTGIRGIAFCGDSPEDPFSRLPLLQRLAKASRISIDRVYWHHSQDLEAVVEVAARDLVARNLRAVLCRNDTLAIRLMRRLQDLGVKVPEQTVVIGYDDTAAARGASPALSTVRAPFGAEGETAVALLADPARMHTPDFETVWMDTQFVPRGTTLPDTVGEASPSVPSQGRA